MASRLPKCRAVSALETVKCAREGEGAQHKYLTVLHTNKDLVYCCLRAKQNTGVCIVG